MRTSASTCVLYVANKPGDFTRRMRTLSTCLLTRQPLLSRTYNHTSKYAGAALERERLGDPRQLAQAPACSSPGLYAEDCANGQYERQAYLGGERTATEAR